ncbi:hypothetical protein D8674_001012 [Pyrus ussuriensis x Pyrus communis]|uniref:Uncharacterized protein n=1 Tax=Pyrus ussuriensis x Pyrus communis TaxID=2448454 RepID=A0A5N5FA33_9ROSA|nr:hypothetical protein D8674_001012 [Pyrus ussuriensis x Pyrus communis]
MTSPSPIKQKDKQGLAKTGLDRSLLLLREFEQIELESTREVKKNFGIRSLIRGKEMKNCKVELPNALFVEFSAA